MHEHESPLAVAHESEAPPTCAYQTPTRLGRLSPLPTTLARGGGVRSQPHAPSRSHITHIAQVRFLCKRKSRCLSRSPSFQHPSSPFPSHQRAQPPTRLSGVQDRPTRRNSEPRLDQHRHLLQYASLCHATADATSKLGAPALRPAAATGQRKEAPRPSPSRLTRGLTSTKRSHRQPAVSSRMRRRCSASSEVRVCRRS